MTNTTHLGRMIHNRKKAATHKATTTQPHRVYSIYTYSQRENPTEKIPERRRPAINGGIQR